MLFWLILKMRIQNGPGLEAKIVDLAQDVRANENKDSQPDKKKEEAQAKRNKVLKI